MPRHVSKMDSNDGCRSFPRNLLKNITEAPTAFVPSQSKGENEEEENLRLELQGDAHHPAWEPKIAATDSPDAGREQTGADAKELTNGLCGHKSGEGDRSRLMHTLQSIGCQRYDVRTYVCTYICQKASLLTKQGCRASAGHMHEHERTAYRWAEKKTACYGKSVQLSRTQHTIAGQSQIDTVPAAALFYLCKHGTAHIG